MAEEAAKPNKATFSQENIIALTEYLDEALRKYAEENGIDGKIDLFLMTAALAQTAFEISYKALPKTDEERSLATAENKRIVDGLLAKLDGIRAEFGTHWPSDLMSSAQLLGVVSEIYCRRRDEQVKKVMGDSGE